MTIRSGSVEAAAGGSPGNSLLSSARSLFASFTLATPVQRLAIRSTVVSRTNLIFIAYPLFFSQLYLFSSNLFLEGLRSSHRDPRIPSNRGNKTAPSQLGDLGIHAPPEIRCFKLSH